MPLSTLTLRVILEANQNLEPEDRELIMELSPLYLERLDAALQSGMQQGMQQGIQQGIQRGQRLVVENLLRIRFGVLDEELREIVDLLLELPPEEYTALLLQLSRDELLARLRK
jgi:flagellar biosynthesis/type III secretory pathway protein FliH